MKKIIQTDQAPSAIGAYSQAVLSNGILYLSGQIPLDPQTMHIVSENFEVQAHQVFKNLLQVIHKAGADASNLVKLTIYLTDLSNFAIVNEVMSQYIKAPYPARAAVEVSRLPKEVQIEIEGIAHLA